MMSQHPDDYGDNTVVYLPPTYGTFDSQINAAPIRPKTRAGADMPFWLDVLFWLFVGLAVAFLLAALAAYAPWAHAAAVAQSPEMLEH